MHTLARITLLPVCLMMLPCVAEARPDVQRPLYQPLRFNEDWSVLANAMEEDRTDRWDPIKYIALNDDGSIWLSFGGSARLRLENWHNFNFGAPPGVTDDDTFLLARMFLHADLHIGQHVRVFVEGKSALATDRELVGGTRTIDVDTLDFHNAFADLRVPLEDGTAFTIRGGRHELLFGRQRLVSPLDWANTRRIFEGVSGILKHGGWTIHGFAVRPVRVDKYELNEADSNIDFYGVNASGPLTLTGGSLDLYWLGLHNDGPVTFNATTGSENRQTIGSRLHGKVAETSFDYDIEGAYQFGELGSSDISAFMIGSQVGYRFDDLWSQPRLFVGFDYASGDRSPGGDVQTFNQLFPLVHAFLGWADVFGRQNIIDLNSGISCSPVDRLTVDVHGHLFWRASRDDGVYSVAGALLRPGNAGDSREVGSEIDLLLRYSIDHHTTLLLGYSHVFPGDFIDQSGPSRSIDFLYASVEYTF